MSYHKFSRINFLNFENRKSICPFCTKMYELMKKHSLLILILSIILNESLGQKLKQLKENINPLSESGEYLETVQKSTFKYFWEFAHPISGMAAERTATPNIVTSGGTGFGILSIIVASHRGWITRKDAVKHLTKMWLIH